MKGGNDDVREREREREEGDGASVDVVMPSLAPPKSAYKFFIFRKQKRAFERKKQQKQSCFACPAENNFRSDFWQKSKIQICKSSCLRWLCDI